MDYNLKNTIWELKDVTGIQYKVKEVILGSRIKLREIPTGRVFWITPKQLADNYREIK
jgi:hypothetical protein